MKGNDVFGLFKSVVVFGENVESLREDLLASIKKKIGDSTLFKISGKEEDDSIYDENGWVCTTFADCIPLTKCAKGRQSAFAYLSFQFSFHGDMVGPAQEPLLHVCLWEVAIDLDENFCVTFPLNAEFGDERKLVGERLITWQSQTKKYPFEWTYSVKLLSITSKADLEALITQPIMELLALHDEEDRDKWEKKAIEKALPDALLEKGLLRYEEEWLNQ